jgi:hypothetical protein
MKQSEPPSKQPSGSPPRPQQMVALIDKPLIARLRESDVMRTLAGVRASGGIPDVTRMGWLRLRVGFPLTTFLNAVRECALVKLSDADATAVMAVIGAGAAKDRSIAALNIALAATRDGAKVLLIDADHVTHAHYNKLNGKREASASAGSASAPSFPARSRPPMGFRCCCVSTKPDLRIPVGRHRAEVGHRHERSSVYSGHWRRGLYRLALLPGADGSRVSSGRLR